MAQEMNEQLKAQMQILYNLCTNCGECSLTCPTHYVGLFNPLGVLRKLQMDGPKTAIKEDNIFNCLTCNRCMTNCPNSNLETGMNFAHLIQMLRLYAVLNDIPANGKADNPGVCAALYQNTENDDNIPLIQNLGLVKNHSALKYQKQGKIAYFPGDIAYYQAHSDYATDLNEIPPTVISLLNKLGITPVYIDTAGSGHDDFWAGNFQVFKNIAHQNIKLYKDAGVSVIICEDAESFYMWKKEYPTLVDDFPFEIYHLSQFLAAEQRMEHLNFEAPMETSYTFQDASRLGRLGGQIYDSPRDILNHIPGVTLKELDANWDDSYDACCGLFMPYNTKTEQMWKLRLKEIAETKVDYYITTSLKSQLLWAYLELNSPQLFDEFDLPRIHDWAVFLSRFVH